MNRSLLEKLVSATVVAAILWITVSSGLSVMSQSTPQVVTDSAQPSIDFRTGEDSESAYINLLVEPGEQTTVSVVLGNNGDVDFDAVTYAANAYTLRNGGFGVEELDSEQSGPTLWMEYPTHYFTTRVGDTFTRDIDITVPLDAEPGEYVTAIAMQTADPVGGEPTEGMFRFRNYYRTVIGVRIVVPGDLAPVLEFGDPGFIVEGAVSAVVVPVKNTGNQQTSPSGELTLRDANDQVLLVAPLTLGPIYGGHDTEIVVSLREPLPDGEYQVSLTLADGPKDIHAELRLETFVISGSGSQISVQSPVTIGSATGIPLPGEDNVQFLAVDTTITNTTEEPVANAQLSLIAMVDGEEVERFPISQSLSVPPGETEVSTRYIPLTGWISGEWEFELLLETVEGSGTAVVVDRVPIDIKVVIP